MRVVSRSVCLKNFSKTFVKMGEEHVHFEEKRRSKGEEECGGYKKGTDKDY